MFLPRKLLKVKKCKLKQVLFLSSASKELEDDIIPNEKTHKKRLDSYFQQNPKVKDLKKYIPLKYLQLKRKKPENLHLIDPIIAKRTVSLILPFIKDNQEQIICETNAGLGLITSELLDNNINMVRLYESCADFRSSLKDFNEVYPQRVELFTKDIYLLHKYAYMDTTDNGNRVQSLLRNVPKKSWTDDPVISIIGPMSKVLFINYLMHGLALQTGLATHGRVQMFAIMRPKDYVVLTSGPAHNLHTYKKWSVLFRLIFNYQFLDKFPRNAFLPWETPFVKKSSNQYPTTVSPDKMYLIHIETKKDLPIRMENLLAFYYFVKQLFGKGRNKVIPTIEKWVPGCGECLMMPTFDYKNEYYEDLNIFTEFGELSPRQILHVFNEMIHHSSYKNSPFLAMIEAELLKQETIETNLNDAFVRKLIIEDLEVKLNT